MGILERVKDALGMNGQRREADMPYGGDDAHLADERVGEPAGVGQQGTRQTGYPETSPPAPGRTEGPESGERS